jgi:hypothetical protein
MWRRVRDGLTAAVLGGFVLLEPPIGSDAGGKWAADTARPVHQWTFVTAVDTAAKCDAKRVDRLADAESDLGVDAESLTPGSKMAAVFDARRKSRCVADGDYFTDAPANVPAK